MKRPIKLTPKRPTKRDLFAELIEGMDALAEQRQGKRTLRTHSVELQRPPAKLGEKRGC